MSQKKNGLKTEGEIQVHNIPFSIIRQGTVADVYNNNKKLNLYLWNMLGDINVISALTTANLDNDKNHF